jgi:hypothetical protein
MDLGNGGGKSGGRRRGEVAGSWCCGRRGGPVGEDWGYFGIGLVIPILLRAVSRLHTRGKSEIILPQARELSIPRQKNSEVHVPAVSGALDQEVRTAQICFCG